MIVDYQTKHAEQIQSFLDDLDKKMFEDEFFTKFIFIDEDEVLGWVVLEPSKDRLLIEWIYVLEEHRQKKIGSQLMEHVKNHAQKQGFRGISVNTGSKTFWARKFYEKHGFEEVGSVKKFFSFDPEHIFYWYQVQ